MDGSKQEVGDDKIRHADDIHKDENQKMPMIVSGDASVEEKAVMIELEKALLTQAAVMGSGRG